ERYPTAGYLAGLSEAHDLVVVGTAGARVVAGGDVDIPGGVEVDVARRDRVEATDPSDQAHLRALGGEDADLVARPDSRRIEQPVWACRDPNRLAGPAVPRAEVPHIVAVAAEDHDVVAEVGAADARSEERRVGKASTPRSAAAWRQT